MGIDYIYIKLYVCLVANQKRGAKIEMYAVIKNFI